jgi:ABC-type uncharacterized transport system permease subunit
LEHRCIEIQLRGLLCLGGCLLLCQQCWVSRSLLPDCLCWMRQMLLSLALSKYLLGPRSQSWLRFILLLICHGWQESRGMKLCYWSLEGWTIIAAGWPGA